MRDRLGTESSLHYVPELNGYSVTVIDERSGDAEFSTESIRFPKVLKHSLNGTSPKIYKPSPDGQSRVIDKDATVKAQAKVTALDRAFESWFRTADGEIEVDGEKIATFDHIETLFNNTKNASVEPQYTGEYMTLPGLANTVYRTPHRMAVVARILAEGSVMMAHGVGSGKTFSLIIAAYEMKRLGMASKPMIVVQNQTIGQFGASYRQAYPNARVLVANDKDLGKDRRKRFLNRVAVGDWDTIIITQSQFDRLNSNEASVKQYFQRQLVELEDAISRSRSDNGSKDATTKELEKAKEKLQVKQLERLEKVRKGQDEGVLSFEDMGVDAVFVDEAHEYKKVPLVTRMGQVKGVPNDHSDKAMNLEMKIAHIHRIKDGKNIVLATGTPVTNSMAEVFVMLRLAAPKVLESYGIRNFDDFAHTFGKVETKTEFTWKGSWSAVSRFAEFINVNELMTMVRLGFDVRMGNKELGIKVPEIVGGEAEIVAIKHTPVSQKIRDWTLDIATEFESLDPSERKENSWVPIVTMGAGMAGALDPRLIDPKLPDHPNSKVNKAISNVMEIYNDPKQGVENKTQMIFADQFLPFNTERLEIFAGDMDKSGLEEFEDGTVAEDAENDAENDEDAEAKAEAKAYKNATGFNLYKDIKAKLIAQGIPEHEIAIMHEYNTTLARTDLFDRVNAGDVRILLGSTAKMGVGVNAHEKLYALHHLDPPRQMTPAMLEQREGRIVRQGNTNANVRILRYGVEKSMDTGIFQLLERKATFIRDLLLGKLDLDKMKDEAAQLARGMAAQVAALTGDVRLLRRVEIEAELMTLDIEKQGFEEEQYALRRKVRELERASESLEQTQIPEAKQLMAWFKANPTEREVTKEDKKGNRKQVSEKRFEFSLGKSSSTSAPQYTDRKDALEALEAEVAKQSSELANRAVKLNETTRISIPMVWNGVEGSLRLEVNPKVLKGLTPSAIEEASYMSMVLRDPQAAGDSNAKLIYSNPISTVEGVLRVFSSVQRSTAAGESVERYERQLKVSKSTVTPYKQRIGATWEGSVAYEALNTELEKLNADLESSSSLRPRAPLEVGIRQPMVGLNPQLKEPMIGLLSRAATVDANQGEFDLSQAQEEPATPINRANLVTDNLALARYFTGRFSASIPTISRSDVLQEANIALLKAAKAYEPNKGKFGAFASRVIRNHLISVYRKESKHRNLSLDVPLNDESKDELGDTISDENTPSPVDEAEQSETKATLGNAINQLPDGVRMVIAARLRGETFKQIGKSLNISAQAAQERYKKALAKLRKGLTQMGVEAEPDGVLRSQGADRMPDTISNEEAQSGAYQIEVLPTVLDMVARWDAGADLYYFHELDEGLHKIKSGVQLLDSAQSDVFSVTRNDNPSPTPRKRTKAELRSAVGDVVDSDTPNGRGRPTTVEDYLSDEYGYDDAISLTYDEIESGIFDSPERILKTAKIDAYHKMGEVMTEADANEVIEGWKAQALKDGKDQANSLKVVLSLFDSSGILSQPWIDAGYTVYRLDLDPESQVAWDVDVNDITIEFLQDHGLDDVDVVLAQPPCTDFACSGAGHFAAKDADGRTQASVDLIDQTIATIGFLRPHMWMLENPIGRIKTLTGLPEARMVFDPFVYGDPYTKRTQIWGDFNPMLPKAVVEPHLGSIITNKLSGSTNKGKRLRSLTPEGFAYSYYMANRDYTKRFAERVERKRKELDGEEAAPTPPMDGAQQIALFSQAGDVSSAKFKSWFGDSKVVDKSGEPLVMYHGKGTDSEIEVFEMREGSRGKGANFTSVYEEAFDYAAEGLGFDVSDGIEGLDDTQLAKVEARIVEAYIKADEVWDSAYGDGVIAVAKSPNDIKSATDNNGNFDPNDPSINRSQPADTSDDQAIIDLIDSLNEVAPDSTATEEAAQAEPAGEQTIGRPDLANPAASPEGRKFVNAQDEARKEQAEVQSHKEWETQARDMLAKDKAGVKRRLLEVAQDSRYNGITDAVDVKASQMLVAEIVEEAVRTGNADQMREAQILTYAYREARSETARALAAGRDPHQTPAQRHKEFLAAMFFRPDHKTEKRIKKALTPAQKSRDIDKLKAKLKQAEANQADKAELIRLRRELLEVKQAPSKTELLTEASSERLQKIEAALEGMGVSLQDIFSGETEVRIKADAIIGNYAAKLPAKRKQAVSMLERGTPINEVRKATGLSMGEINDITEDFERDYMAKHEAKYLAKLKGMEVAGSSEADLEVISLLKSAPGGLGEAELKALARKAMLKDIAAMGMGKGAKSKSVQAQLRRKSGVGKRRKAKQTGSIEGLDYEWEMDAPKQGDRYQQGAAQRDLDDNLEPPQFDISNPIDVARIARIAETVDADGFDMAYEFWINSILSGPQTHVANITGNALNMTLDMTLQRGMEVAINSTLSAIGQGDADSAQIGEFKHMIHGIMPGIMDGWKSAQAAWLTETSQFEARVLGTQMELGGVGKLENYKTTISGTKGRIIRIPGRALFFMDELFKGIIGRIEVGAQAYRIAKQEGLKGKAMQQRIAGLVNLVGSDAWVKAAEKAKELTFQSDFEEGTTMHKAAKLAYNAKKDARWSRFIVPFVRTILNIFAVGVRKSPVGSINLVTRMAQQGLLTTRGDGSFGARSYGRGALIKHLAEQVIAFGTTAALYGAMEGDDDDDEKFFLITGSRPFNTTKYGVSELHNRAGTPAYSLRMGNFVFQYGRYEPVSTALGITTDLSRVIKQSDKRSGDEVFGLLASSIAEQVMSKTFARGLSDMFEAARDPQRFFSRWASNFASSWMPNIIKQPLRLADSSKRNGSVENRTMAGSLAERVKEQMLPFTKSQKIDVWGNEVKAKGNVVSRLVVPQAVGTIERLNRADKTLQKWNQLNPAETYAPTPVSRRIELDGESYYMNDEEFVAFQKDAGQKAFKLIQRVSLNQGAPTERDIKLIQKAIASGRSAARDTFRRKNRNKTR